MTDEEKTIRSLTAAGWTESAIAKRLGRSRYWLASRRFELNIPRPPKPQRVSDRPVHQGAELLATSSPYSEAKHLLPLLEHGAETIGTVRHLISVSGSDEIFLLDHFESRIVARIKDYRQCVLVSFERLVKERNL